MNYEENLGVEAKIERSSEYKALKFKEVYREFYEAVYPDLLGCSSELVGFLTYDNGNEENLIVKKNKLITSLTVFKRIVEDLSNNPENESIKHALKNIEDGIEYLLTSIDIDGYGLLYGKLKEFKGIMSGIKVISDSIVG